MEASYVNEVLGSLLIIYVVDYAKCLTKIILRLLTYPIPTCWSAAKWGLFKSYRSTVTILLYFVVLYFASQCKLVFKFPSSKNSLPALRRVECYLILTSNLDSSLLTLPQLLLGPSLLLNRLQRFCLEPISWSLLSGMGKESPGRASGSSTFLITAAESVYRDRWRLKTEAPQVKRPSLEFCFSLNFLGQTQLSPVEEILP